MNKAITINKEKGLSFKVQTGAAAFAICLAVALPQICHVLGRAFGVKSAIGEILLPMHLPVICVGLLAGAYAGGLAGLIAPLVSFLLTGMPGEAMLPFMMIELCVYGVVAGLLKDVKVYTIVKVLIAQIAGRAVRAVAILFAFNVLGLKVIKPFIIINSIKVGMIGIIIQLVFIPLFIMMVNRMGGANE